MILAGVSLTVIPLLLLGSTSLLATNRAEQRFGERHAADAGVEDALWRIKWDDSFDSTIPYTNTLDFNGHSTEVLIEPALLPLPVYPDPVPSLDTPLTPLQSGGRIKIWESVWWGPDTVPCYGATCTEPQDFYFTIFIENYGTTRVHTQQFGACLAEGFTFGDVVEVQNILRSRTSGSDTLLTADELNVPTELTTFSLATGDNDPFCDDNRQQVRWVFDSPQPYVESPATQPPGIGMITYRATATELTSGRYCNEAWAEPNPAVYGGIIPSGGCELNIGGPQWDITSTAGGVSVKARATIMKGQADEPITVISWQTDHSPGPVSDPNGMHVGDLEDALIYDEVAGDWDANIVVTVHYVGHGPISGVTVEGVFRVDALTSEEICITDSSGQCNISHSVPGIDGGVFEVTGLVGALGYDPSQNHDLSPDSNGTVILLDVD